MAMTKRYHTLNGRIRSETTGGTTTNYLTDALGSVVGTAGASGAVLNTYRYKPYGELLAKTGLGADPLFLWTGDTGSRVTDAKYAEQYNRARHYGREQAAWTSVDPLWPSQSPYRYTRGNPLRWIDPSGLIGQLNCLSLPPRPMGPPACTPAWNAYIFAYCNCSSLVDPFGCDALARGYYNSCKGQPGPGLFGPPPGGPGEIAPRPYPPLPSLGPGPKNCFTAYKETPEDCGKEATEYVESHWDEGHGAPPAIGAVAACGDCCRRNGFGDDCTNICLGIAIAGGSAAVNELLGDAVQKAREQQEAADRAAEDADAVGGD